MTVAHRVPELPGRELLDRLARHDLVEPGQRLGQVDVDAQPLDVTAHHGASEVGRDVPPARCGRVRAAHEHARRRWQWLVAHQLSAGLRGGGAEVRAVRVVDEAGLVDARRGRSHLRSRRARRAGRLSRCPGGALNHASTRATARRDRQRRRSRWSRIESRRGPAEQRLQRNAARQRSGDARRGRSRCDGLADLRLVGRRRHRRGLHRQLLGERALARTQRPAGGGITHSWPGGGVAAQFPHHCRLPIAVPAHMSWSALRAPQLSRCTAIAPSHPHVFHRPMHLCQPRPRCAGNLCTYTCCAGDIVQHGSPESAFICPVLRRDRCAPATDRFELTGRRRNRENPSATRTALERPGAAVQCPGPSLSTAPSSPHQ